MKATFSFWWVLFELLLSLDVVAVSLGVLTGLNGLPIFYLLFFFELPVSLCSRFYFCLKMTEVDEFYKHSSILTLCNWTMERGNLLGKKIELPARFARRIVHCSLVYYIKWWLWSSYLKSYYLTSFLKFNVRN